MNCANIFLVRTGFKQKLEFSILYLEAYYTEFTSSIGLVATWDAGLYDSSTNDLLTVKYRKETSFLRTQTLSSCQSHIQFLTQQIILSQKQLSRPICRTLLLRISFTGPYGILHAQQYSTVGKHLIELFMIIEHVVCIQHEHNLGMQYVTHLTITISMIQFSPHVLFIKFYRVIYLRPFKSTDSFLEKDISMLPLNSQIQIMSQHH